MKPENAKTENLKEMKDNWTDLTETANLKLHKTFQTILSKLDQDAKDFMGKLNESLVKANSWLKEQEVDFGPRNDSEKQDLKAKERMDDESTAGLNHHIHPIVEAQKEPTEIEK